MLSNLTGWHAVVILAVILLVFGAAKLPALAKSVGQSVRILKDEAATDARIENPQTTPHHNEATAASTAARTPTALS